MRPRRLAPHAVDELDPLLRTLLEFRKGDGNRLPGYTEPILAFLGTRPDGLARMGEIRDHFGLRQARTGRLCAALARAGLVDITPSTEDGRSFAVKLTPKGNRLIDKALSALRSRSQ
jgi:hypothetical protein